MRSLIALLSILIGTASMAFAQAPVTPGTEAQRAMRDETQRLRNERDALRALASRQITMREAVKRAGGSLIISAAPGMDAFTEANVGDLTSKSRLVVSGRVIGVPKARLSEDGRSVVTRYYVQVENMRRGALPARELPALVVSVPVDVPGGKLTFPEGTVEVTGGAELTVGQRYLLFLQRSQDAPSFEEGPASDAVKAAAAQTASEPGFVITGQHREGLFRVDDDKVRSLAAATSPRVKELYDGRLVRDLMGEVRSPR